MKFIESFKNFKKYNSTINNMVEEELDTDEVQALYSKSLELLTLISDIVGLINNLNKANIDFDMNIIDEVDFRPHSLKKLKDDCNTYLELIREGNIQKIINYRNKVFNEAPSYMHPQLELFFPLRLRYKLVHNTRCQEDEVERYCIEDEVRTEDYDELIENKDGSLTLLTSYYHDKTFVLVDDDGDYDIEIDVFKDVLLTDNVVTDREYLDNLGIMASLTPKKIAAKLDVFQILSPEYELEEYYKDVLENENFKYTYIGLYINYLNDIQMKYLFALVNLNMELTLNESKKKKVENPEDLHIIDPENPDPAELLLAALSYELSKLEDEPSDELIRRLIPNSDNGDNKDN